MFLEEGLFQDDLLSFLLDYIDILFVKSNGGEELDTLALFAADIVSLVLGVNFELRDIIFLAERAFNRISRQVLRKTRKNLLLLQGLLTLLADSLDFQIQRIFKDLGELDHRDTARFNLGFYEVTTPTVFTLSSSTCVDDPFVIFLFFLSSLLDFFEFLLDVAINILVEIALLHRYTGD